MQFFRYCAVTVALAAGLAAAPISGLVSTGINVAGNQDLNWQVTLPGAVTQQGWVTDSAGFPFNYWMGNDADSSWISPQAGYYGAHPSNTDIPGGAYLFTTTFDLSAPEAWFTMRLLVDNQLTDVELNRVSLGIQYLAGPTENMASFQEWSPVYSVNSGFQSGLNTLQFRVLNGRTDLTHNPTGVRVEILDSGQVPEPSTFAMCGLGAGLLGLGAWRRRRV